jgi:hypothetical protein
LKTSLEIFVMIKRKLETTRVKSKGLANQLKEVLTG